MNQKHKRNVKSSLNRTLSLKLLFKRNWTISKKRINMNNKEIMTKSKYWQILTSSLIWLMNQVIICFHGREYRKELINLQKTKE